MTATDLVVDASVVVKLFVEEDLSREAELLFQRLTVTPPARFYVPDLLFLECANVLWKYVRYGYDPRQARHAIADLLLLPLEPVAATELLDGAFELAVESGITAYDAAYVALARGLEVPLVTADRRLGRKLATGDVEVRWLGALSLT